MTPIENACRAALLLGALLAGTGPAFAQTRSTSAPSDIHARRGHELFLQNGCYLCHGTVGQGGVGPAIGADVLPYVAISNYVRAPSGQMPPFSTRILSDADLHDIYAYLVSLPKPAAADSIPLLPKVDMAGAR
jgi:ubiquinol-cytochrome c reductase cytochrome c subunit